MCTSKIFFVFLQKTHNMPINKNAYLRYQVLDKCFSNFQKKYSWEDLLDVVNKVLVEHNGENSHIARTQLFKDINFMKSETGFSIELGDYKEGRKKYYRYVDKEFSIKNNPLNSVESESIKSAISVLSRFKGLPQFEWLEELIPTLSDKFQIGSRRKQTIFFDSNIDYSGIHLIEPIFNAINNENVLEIKYKDFKSPSPYSITFHPYILKQYNNRWFVFGLNEYKEIPTWNFALDRIVSIKETKKEYRPFQFDWENDHFYDIIGVTRKQEIALEEVKLKFEPSLAPYVQTKPIHPTQSKPRLLENGDVVITIKVIPNYELERLILSFGERVEVVSPESLRKKIFNRVLKNIEQYDL